MPTTNIGSCGCCWGVCCIDPDCFEDLGKTDCEDAGGIWIGPFEFYDCDDTQCSEAIACCAGDPPACQCFDGLTTVQCGAIVGQIWPGGCVVAPLCGDNGAGDCDYV